MAVSRRYDKRKSPWDEPIEPPHETYRDFSVCPDLWGIWTVFSAGKTKVAHANTLKALREEIRKSTAEDDRSPGMYIFTIHYGLDTSQESAEAESFEEAQAHIWLQLGRQGLLTLPAPTARRSCFSVEEED